MQGINGSDEADRDQPPSNEVLLATQEFSQTQTHDRDLSESEGSVECWGKLQSLLPGRLADMCMWFDC